MATFKSGLFGSTTPQEVELANRKLWQGMYTSAQSPYEKMGLALAQIGGAVLGIDETEGAFQKQKDIEKVLGLADASYTPGTAEYYKFVAQNLPAEYADSRAYAIQEYKKAEKAELETTVAVNKQVKDNPETLNDYIAPLAQNLLSKASKKGWNPEETPVPESKEEIKAFATLYGLDKDPDYRRLVTLTNLAEKESRKETQEEEKRLLTMDQIRSTIARNSAELGKISNDKFEAGARWNEERNSAIELFKANGLDPRKPLKGINLANTELVNAQRIALREPWTGKSGATIKQPGETTPAPGGKSASEGGDIKQQVTNAFGAYEPNKYDYRIVNGQVQRKAK